MSRSLGRLLVHDLVADAQLTLGDVLEAGDHPQRGRLPAAGRADGDHRPILDLEMHVAHRLESRRGSAW